MSTDRGGRRAVGSKNKSRAARPAIRLARGVRLDGGKKKDEVLICPSGKVQLNRIAAAILCDGSHNREEVVATVLRNSQRQARAEEIIEFLDVAQARGWIDET